MVPPIPMTTVVRASWCSKALPFSSSQISWQEHSGVDLAQPHGQHGELYWNPCFDNECHCSEDEKALATTLLLTDSPYHQTAQKSQKLGTVTNTSLVMFHFFYWTGMNTIFLTLRWLSASVMYLTFKVIVIWRNIKWKLQWFSVVE